MNNFYDEDPNEIPDDIKITIIKINTVKEWDLLKKRMKKMFYERGKQLNIDNEGVAMSCNVLGTPFVILCDELFKELSEDTQAVILAHESAHAGAGILDEEKADIWALQALRNSKTQQALLINSWKHRHGHEYEGEY